MFSCVVIDGQISLATDCDVYDCTCQEVCVVTLLMQTNGQVLWLSD